MSEWISVEDKLPEKNVYVWVYDKKPSIEYGYDVHTACIRDDGFWYAGNDAETDPHDIAPSHWMVLVRPEPPHPT